MLTVLILLLFAFALLMAIGALMILLGLIGDVLRLLSDDPAGAPPGE